MDLVIVSLDFFAVSPSLSSTSITSGSAGSDDGTGDGGFEDGPWLGLLASSSLSILNK